MAQTGMRAAHQVKRFRIRGSILKEAFQSVASVFKLAGGNVSRANFAPDFVLAMGWIAGDNLFKVPDRVSESFLQQGDAPQLIMGIDLVVVDLYSSLETLPRCLNFTAALMNQSEVVMCRRIRGIQRCRFEVLFERLARVECV